MKILVNGTEKEMIARGMNGIEWTQDLLGNHDALHYDGDIDEYIMAEEEFEWWNPVIDKLNKIEDLLAELDEEARAEFDQEYWPSDLDDMAESELEWLKNKIQEQ